MSARQQAAARAYWTPERLASAVDLDALPTVRRAPTAGTPTARHPFSVPPAQPARRGAGCEQPPRQRAAQLVERAEAPGRQVEERRLPAEGFLEPAPRGTEVDVGEVAERQGQIATGRLLLQRHHTTDGSLNRVHLVGQLGSGLADCVGTGKQLRGGCRRGAGPADDARTTGQHSGRGGKAALHGTSPFCTGRFLCARRRLRK